MTLAEFNKKKDKLPEAPGVYFFMGGRKEILYIGKAASLRDRVRSYFSPDLGATRGAHIVRMVEFAKSIEWRETPSVLEALILESNLIKVHKPEFNTLAKDDKSFNYVVITEEAFPRVMLMRGKELGPEERARMKAVFGPFPHGMQLRIAMKIIRRIFPYRDTCHPAGSPENKTGKACFNRQIGLCPGVCTGEISAPEYARTVRHIQLFFEGKKQILMRELQREMKAAAREERFEEAGQYKRQLFALQHIQDVALIKDEYRAPAAVRESESDRIMMRIEAYDIAHLRGAAAYGVMTVVENGERVLADYRLFRIRAAKAGDDSGALREVLSRRLAHDEWPMPRLIVVDGATAQMNAAQKILVENGFQIPIVGVVKDEHHRPREIRAGLLASRETTSRYEREILLANAEAHRFAIARHRKTLRLRSLRG